MAAAIFILFGLIAASNANLSSVISFQGQASPKRLNEREDTRVECLITTERPPAKSFKLIWYKQQGDKGDQVLIARDDVLSNPLFKPDKYKSDYELNYNDQPTQTLFHLAIKGVEAVDAGFYRCAFGDDERNLASSDNAELIINPARGQVVSVQTTAPEDADDDYYVMNDPSEVICSTTVKSNSKTLDLQVLLGDVDITPEFVKTSRLDWQGSGNLIGLHFPVQTIQLENKAWRPSDYLKYLLKCNLRDASIEIATKHLKVKREKPPITTTVGCSSNNKHPIRYGDAELVITCIVHGQEELRNPKIVFSFAHENEIVNMTTNQALFDRTVDKVDDATYVLKVTRVTYDMVKPGEHQGHYNVSIWETDASAPAAATSLLILTDPKTDSAISGTMKLSPVISLTIFTTLAKFYWE